MNKKLQKSVSVVTSITTTIWLSGVVMLAPMAALAVDVVDGDLIRNSSAEGMAQFDIYIVKLVGEKKFKRLVLSPHVFESYEHFDKNGNGDNWDDVVDVDQATMDSCTTSDLVREDGVDNVYRLHAEEGADTGDKYWLNMTAAEFLAVFDADAIYTINSTDTAGYTAGANVTDASATFPPGAVESTGTLTATLAADTPAASIAVGSAARLAFTKVNLTATGGDVIVDSMVVQRTGLAQDGSFSSLDLIDGDTNLPLNNTSKTFNSLHQATFTDDFTVANGTTKSVIIAANMATITTLGSYSGEAPTLSLSGVTVKDDASLNASLPLTGNAMTINNTITIGTAVIQRGAYGNATSTSIQVGKEDYTFFSFQVAAGSTEKVEFSQIKVYQEGSASLGSDVINLELLQDGTKIADGVVASSKYANFSFDTITLDKGQTLQFQIKADIGDGSARTINLGIYKTTDLLVKGLTYGYNITPTYSGTGSSASSPVLSDNQFTISNGTLQVTRSNTIGAGNISVGNDQYLGAFSFECKGEPISITSVILTITSTGAATIEDALTGLELVDSSGNIVAGPTDPALTTVTWTDTFTVPVGTSVYKVRGDLSTSGAWESNETIYVSVTPSGFIATGDVTGNTITASPASALNGNTQTVKAASLTVTRNTLPASATIIVNQNDVVLSSWNFDATASGEDIRITSVLWAGKGWAATNTNALTTFIDEDKDGAYDTTDTVQSPVNDALATSATIGAASSTFAFTDPIIITKGTSVHVALKGDKDTVASNAYENWGLGDGTLSVIAYGVTTGNEVDETITVDHGPTLTSAASGTLTVETEGNPSSAIMLAGTTGNVFTNVKLSARYEDLRVDNLIVYVGNGLYSFNTAETDYYNDIASVSLYDGTTLLKSASIPSTGYYTFEFDVNALTIPKSGSKTITVKADMSTIDPDVANAPGTANSDLKIGFGGTDGVKTTGSASNSEVTDTNEDYRSSTSSAMVLRVSKPTVTLPTSSNSLGAATTLANGNVVLYAYKITADASGGDVLLYRNTFVVATSGTSMTVDSLRIVDEDGNTVGAVSTPDDCGSDGAYEYWDTFTFNSPDVDNGDVGEAIKIAAGTSETFKLYGTITGAASGENFTTFLVGDTASTSDQVNSINYALATNTEGWAIPNGDLSNMLGGKSNFIWSDNYSNKSITGTGYNNATSAAQWYNGHLVPGLSNVVSTTAYTIGY